MIERGVLTVDLQPVQLRDIVELALKDYAADIRDKGLALNLEETAADIVVIADEGKLVEALRNIIHNALKFTDNGSITIRTGSEGEYGTIEVTDTGRGMSDRELETLFVKEKVLSGGPKAGEGATLGLYIARGFMERQHGDITVTSAVGKGSTFTLKVPRK
jgi:two-component system sensor histidine kinase ChiS